MACLVPHTLLCVILLCSAHSPPRLLRPVPLQAIEGVIGPLVRLGLLQRDGHHTLPCVSMRPGLQEVLVHSLLPREHRGYLDAMCSAVQMSLRASPPGGHFRLSSASVGGVELFLRHGVHLVHAFAAQEPPIPLSYPQLLFATADSLCLMGRYATALDISRKVRSC